LFAQTTEFMAFCAFAAVGISGLLAWFRVQLILARLREQNETRVAERDQIARDLHDTLLQSVDGLIVKVYVATLQLPLGDPTRAFLTHCLNQAEALSVEGRQKLLGLTNNASARCELSQALAALGVQLFTGAAAAFCARREGVARDLTKAWDDVFGIAREAIINAYKHSRARHVEVGVVYGPASLTVQVRDDGCGMREPERAGSRAVHSFGLRAMRQRAERLRAMLQIDSALNQGTTIRLVVPSEVAYLDGFGDGVRPLLASLGRKPKWSRKAAVKLV
jgi:signal transduction histidine kinase